MSDFKNLEAIWEPISEILKTKHFDTAYNLWFSDMEFVSLTAKEAMFTTTSNVKRDVILENFADEIQDALFTAVLQQLIHLLIRNALLFRKFLHTFILRITSFLAIKRAHFYFCRAIWGFHRLNPTL